MTLSHNVHLKYKDKKANPQDSNFHGKRYKMIILQKVPDCTKNAGDRFLDQYFDWLIQKSLLLSAK